MARDFENIPGRYGYSIERTGPLEASGRVPALPSLMGPDGAMRAAAVLMGIDMTCGMVGGLGVLPMWTVTADVDAHFVGRCLVGPLRVDARCVRGGRTMSVVSARVVDEGAGDSLVAIATANHGVLESDFQHFLAAAAPGDTQVFARPTHAEGESLEEYFGLVVVGDDVRMPLTVRSTNPWGIFHGGLTGLVVDRSARHAGLVELDDVAMRFLNPVRTGPAVATVTEVIRRAEDRVVRIEVHDGTEGRLAVIADVVGR